MGKYKGVTTEPGIYRKRLNKSSVLTVPNVLSFIRIALVPVIAVLYIVANEYYWAGALIIFSGATDVIDGWIARKFNCISDFGKFIDPLADKLTQCTVILCLCTRHFWMVILFVIQVVKELVVFAAGNMLLRKKDTINSARWYGKVTTVLLYSMMVSLVMFPEIPDVAVLIMSIVSGLAILTSLVLYLRYFIGEIKK